MASDSHEQEPVKIVGVIEEDVGVPRNDGSPGSALYEVPFRLSREPSERWAEFFIDAWNRPRQFTTMHRPGIARVQGNRVVLDGTTIEEVERYHLKTLRFAVERANELTAQWQRARAQGEQSIHAEEDEHRRHVKEVAKRLKFD